MATFPKFRDKAEGTHLTESVGDRLDYGQYRALHAMRAIR